MQRIAITGAMCTGKTTLAIALAKQYQSVLVPDAGRLYFLQSPHANRSTLETNRAIAREYVQSSQRASNTGLAFVFHDNCILSPVAHLLAFGKRRYAEVLLTEFAPEIAQFDRYLLLDTQDIVYRDDEIRTEGATIQKKLQASYIQLLRQLDIPYTLVSGNEAERLRYMQALLAR